jgi:hypothetical protein
MKKYIAVLATFVVFAAVSAGFALADPGGQPNENACHGQIVSFFSSEVGLTPGKAAKLFDVNAGDINKFVKAICD